MQFGFATSECHGVELAAQRLWWGKGHGGAAGGEFAFIFLD